MITLRAHQQYTDFLRSVKDLRTRAVIQANVSRLSIGLGDWKAIGEGVFELRIAYGPGWRVYFIKQGLQFIVLLGGGTKSGQQRDIIRAIDLAKSLRATNNP